MNIVVTREACCGQDDQIGPLKINLSSAELNTIQSLARQIDESKFLQFSSPLNVIEVRSGGQLLFNIPALNHNNGEVKYFVEKTDKANSYIVDGVIKCTWPKSL